MKKNKELLIEQLKKDFSGSSDYLSGVNDGMYCLMRNLDHMDELSDEVFEKLNIHPTSEVKEQSAESAKDYLSKNGYGSGTNYTTSAVAGLMEQYHKEQTRGELKLFANHLTSKTFPYSIAYGQKKPFCKTYEDFTSDQVVNEYLKNK